MKFNMRPLVADRVCGECSECCISLKINDLEIKKNADTKCQNLLPNGGCSIYKSRPVVCQSWYCGWRRFQELDDSMRPDKSGLMIKSDDFNELVLQLAKGKSDRVLWSEKTIAFIALLRDEGFKTATSVPTKPGFCNAKSFIDIHLTNDLIKSNMNDAKKMMKGIIFHAKYTQTKPEHPAPQVTTHQGD